MLGLDDHCGSEYFGLHQRVYYSGLAWANELARRDYVVLVHLQGWGYQRANQFHQPSEFRGVRLVILPVRTYTVCMNLTLSVDDQIVQKARRRAESLGTSVNQLVRDYLEQLAGKSNLDHDADEFERLSLSSNANPTDYKFNRDELHERR